MSASLVGSEMCIRDSSVPFWGPGHAAEGLGVSQEASCASDMPRAVARFPRVAKCLRACVLGMLCRLPRLSRPGCRCPPR
eukprot:12364053-Alexandrium_andersonii.AAC.1